MSKITAVLLLVTSLALAVYMGYWAVAYVGEGRLGWGVVCAALFWLNVHNIIGVYELLRTQYGTR